MRATTVREWFPTKEQHHAVKPLYHWAKAIRLIGAAWLARALVNAIPATVSRPEDREHRLQRRAGHIYSVAQGSSVLFSVNQNPCQGPQGDVKHVVRRTPSVRPTGQVSRQETEALLAGDTGGRNAGVEAQQIGNRAGVCRLAAGTNGRHVLNQGKQVNARRGRDRHAEGRENLRDQRVQQEVGELAVLDRVVHAEPVLRTGTDDGLIDQRITQALDLRPASPFAGLAEDAHPGTGSGAIRPDYGFLVAGGVDFAIARQHADGHFQGDGIDIESRQGVGGIVMLVVPIHSGAEHRGAGVFAHIQGVEDAAHIDEEGVRHGAGEDADAIVKRVDALLPKLPVVGHGTRTHVGRYGVQGLIVGQPLTAGGGDHGDAVSLPEAKTLRAVTIQRRDRRYPREASDEARKHAWISGFCFEAELEDYVRNTIMIVVDFHFIEDAGIERKVVRAVRRLQERVDVEDQDHAVGMFRAHEGKPICDVGLLIQGSDRRLAVAGRERGWWLNCERRGHDGHRGAQSGRYKTHGDSPFGALNLTFTSTYDLVAAPDLLLAGNFDFVTFCRTEIPQVTIRLIQCSYGL